MYSINASQYRTIQGLNIAYNRQGKGESIIMIHGITTSSFIWRNIQPTLAEKYDTIAVDLLGCGNSSKDLTVDYSIKNQASIIAALISDLNIQKIHIIGHDIGGGIAQILAVKHQELISDLILMNTIGYNYWPVQPITTMRTPIFRQLAMMSLDMGMLGNLVKKGLYKKESFTHEFKSLVWKEMADKKRRKSFLHFAKCLNNQHLMEIASELKKINFPVLIIRGEGDLYLNNVITTRLGEDIPGSEVVKIKSGGHYIQEDEPELLTSLIINFFNKNRRQ
jgi:pimeloyl-ACP methyl ester carboxylesterase